MDASLAMDAGSVVDGSSRDSPLLDAAPHDAGPADAFADGGVRPDAGPADAGPADAGAADAGLDAGVPADAAVGPLGWPQIVSGPGSAIFHDLAVDGSSNVYALVGSPGSVITGGEAFEASTAALLSYDRDGALRWYKNFAMSIFPTRVILPTHLATDPAGNVYVAGTVSGTFSFDGVSVTAPRSSVFLYSMSSDGAQRWLVYNTTGQEDVVMDLIADAGGVCLSGRTAVTLTLGGGSVDGRGFAARISPDGVYRLGIGADATTVYSVYIAGAPDGGLFVAGLYGRSGVDVGGGIVPVLDVSGAASCFLARYSPDGSHLWSRRVLGQSDPTGRVKLALNALAVDETGRPYLVGRFTTELHTDIGIVGPFDNPTGFVVALDEDGVHRWQQTPTPTGIGSVMLADATPGAAGRLMIAGSISGTTDLGIVMGTSGDAILVEYADDGTYLGGRLVGGSSLESGLAVAWDAADSLAYFGGIFEGTMEEGGRTLVADRSDVFITR